MSACELLTEAEAAARLRLSPRTLRSIRRQGQIRYIALSARKIAYRAEDCEEYIAKQVRISELPSTAPRPSKRPRRSGKIIPFSQQVG